MLWFVETGEFVWPVATRKPLVKFSPMLKSIPKRARRRNWVRFWSAFNCGANWLPVVSNGCPVLMALKFGKDPVTSLPFGNWSPSYRTRRSKYGFDLSTHLGRRIL